MKHLSPHILFINPWIDDFAAYNLWIRPLGLLHIAGLLRRYGFKVTLVDCLDFRIKKRRYGDGNFFKTRIEKPKPLKTVPRHYSRYGVPEEDLLHKFSSIEKPDVIGITSGMTYWYPGLFRTIEITRTFFGDVPILLGGIYATLCYEHASEYSGADFIIQGRGELKTLKLLSQLTHAEPHLPPLADEFDFKLRTPCLSGRQANSRPRTDLDLLPYPAFDLYPQLDYVCIATSKGCPFSCTYCASRFLGGAFARRDPLKVVEEIEYWTTRSHVKNIAFYDDALLMEPPKHIVPILREVIRRRLRCNFHAPNALHVREMDEEVTELLFRGGFKTIRLGLETSDQRVQFETGGKVTNQDFRRAVINLKKAGYLGEEVGVYIMVGMPGQKVKEAEESIAFVKETDAKPILVEYSPVPNTPMFQKAMAMSRFDLENEPLVHNNSILPCQWNGFTWEDYRRLKEGLRRRWAHETP